MDDAPPQPTAEQDPVCGREIDARATGHALLHEGRFYHFCSSSCLRRFVAEPARFVAEPDAPVRN